MEACRKKTRFTEFHYVPETLVYNKRKKEKKEKQTEDVNQTYLKSKPYFGNVSVCVLWPEMQLVYEIQQLASYSRSDCQMSHCLLFVITQVENDRAQAPERSNTEGVFRGVHLKCCCLDALSTAKGLFVS